MRLNDTHKAYLSLHSEAMTCEEIAAYLGVTPQSAWNIAKYHHWQFRRRNAVAAGESTALLLRTHHSHRREFIAMLADRSVWNVQFHLHRLGLTKKIKKVA